ncbi:MAG: sigma-70 family RNA polymerase sigma factor [Lachnospiraceae bacterium]|nr:sigma-70 family RNA polymerase sigma factor [Lachnospiraceae bacterium]MCI9133827.1 sigma-70 family RNA polymerase sigma factor [Lachnospiraceae bacterium]
MEILLDRYRGMVKYQARTLYLMGGDQEDLIQEGMIGLFKAIRDYSPEKIGGFAAFAKLCVARQLYKAVQASNRQKHMPLNTYVELSPELHEGPDSPLEQSPEELLIAQEDLLSLQERLRSCLSRFESQVLEQYLEGKNYLEIARELQKSPKSVDNALQRIRRKAAEAGL